MIVAQSQYAEKSLCRHLIFAWGVGHVYWKFIYKNEIIDSLNDK